MPGSEKNPDPLLIDVWRQNDEQKRVLGDQQRMLGDQQHLLGALGANMEILLKDRDKASEQRQRTYDKLEQIDGRAGVIEARLSACETTLRQIEPTVKELDRDRQRVIGGGAATRVLGGYLVHVVWSLITLGGMVISALLVWLKHTAQGL